ncbi:MAG: ribonuclease III [Candidatus Jorgensenbacteria bacterium]
MSDLSDLEKKISFEFKNKDFLEESLTHRSYLNEYPGAGAHNERLEFLGDAVLELVVTEYLFHVYPDHQEGQLTSLRAALVNYQMLSKIAKEIGLEEYLRLSKGEAKDTGRARDVILANAIEALIGAIYLDAGYDGAKGFVKKFVMNHLDEVIENKLYRDPKSTLQEVAQENLKVTPIYKVLSEMGPDHSKEFVVGVFFGEELKAEGRGLSKQEAEVKAAETALEKLAD